MHALVLHIPVPIPSLVSDGGTALETVPRAYLSEILNDSKVRLEPPGVEPHGIPGVETDVSIQAFCLDGER